MHQYELNFSLFKFPVRIQPMFWFGCFFFGGGFYIREYGVPAVLAGMVAVFISILFHELGHAFAVRYFGGAPAITLTGMGGFVNHLNFFRPKQKIIITAAGPLFGATLAVCAFFLTPVPMPALLAWFVLVMFWINTVWTVFNLLPIIPMDGGQILREALGARRLKLSLQISVITAMIFSAIALILLKQIFAAALLGFMAYGNFRDLKQLGDPFRL